MLSERRVLLTMCILVGANEMGFGAAIPVLPLYAVSFGVSAGAVGMAIALYGFARLCVAAPCGWLADRFGRRYALIVGGLLVASGNLWCALVGGYTELLASRFVVGAGAGLIITGGQIVLADISSPARRGRMLAVYHGSFLACATLGQAPGGWLAAHFGLNAPFLAYTGLGLITAAVAFFMLRETRELAREKAAAAGPPMQVAAALRRLRGQIGFVLVCAITLVNAVTRTGGLFSLVPLIASTRLGLSVDQIGAGMATGSLIGLAMIYPSGMLVDYFGRKWVIAPATCLQGVAILLFCVAGSVGGFFLACVTWGFAGAVSGAAPAAYAADSAPPGMNALTVSLFRMAGDIGYVSGPLFLGLLADARGPEFSLTLTACLSMSMASLFAWRAPETHRNRR